MSRRLAVDGPEVADIFVEQTESGTEVRILTNSDSSNLTVFVDGEEWRPVE